MGDGDGDRAAEATQAVAMALTLYPPDKMWPTRRLRMLLAADREKALRRAYVLGVQDGVVAAQEDMDRNPGRFSSICAQLDAGHHPTTPLFGSLPFDSHDFANIAEHLAACERYGAGHGIGYVQLFAVRRARASG